MSTEMQLSNRVEVMQTATQRAHDLANLVAMGMSYAAASNQEVPPAQVQAFAETVALLLAAH